MEGAQGVLLIEVMVKGGVVVGVDVGVKVVEVAGWFER